MKPLTERGILSAKVVGTEMRKFQKTTCNAAAVRVMTTAVEMFMGTLAREAYLHPGDEKKKNVTMTDIQRLVHEEDLRFGFLARSFDPPGRKKGNRGKQQQQQQVQQIVQQQKEDAEKRDKRVKPVHRPKLEFSSAAKLYEARNPGGTVFDQAPDKQKYVDEFKAMKAALVVAEEKWKQEFPDEYQGMLQKREQDRERARKRKGLAPGEPLPEMASTAGLIPMQALLAPREPPVVAKPQKKKAKKTAASATAPATAATSANPATGYPEYQQQEGSGIMNNYSSMQGSYGYANNIGGGSNLSPLMSPSNIVGTSPQRQTQQQQQQFQQQQQQYYQQQQQQQQQQQYQYQQQQQQRMAYPQGASNAAGYQQKSSQAGAVAAAQGTQQRVLVDDATVRIPWKKVNVINTYTGLIEDEYYWNTSTNATSWERPPRY
jgi:histone H3/H4